MATTHIILLTGFLGAGKTTVLKQILTAMGTDSGTKIGIIVNEFGKVSIDGPVLRRPGLAITELNNGSIFCQCLAGTFVDSIVQMLGYDLEYLLIESTGLADPSNMKDILQSVRHKTDLPYEYSGVLCVVDAKYFRKLSQSLDTINRQILAASLIVVNKADLVDEETLEQVKGSIRRLNPLATVVSTTYGAIDPEHLGSIRRSRLASRMPSLNTPASRPRTLLLKTSDNLQRQSLEAFIERIQDRIYRLKGLICLEEGCFRLDVVGQDIRFEPTSLAGEQSELVIIPQPGIDLREEVTALLGEILYIKADII